jgi:hypothetical protein
MKQLGLIFAGLLCACGPSSRGTPALDAKGNGDGRTIDAPPVAPDAAPTGPVDVIITADNAYSFGYGDSTHLIHFTQGTRATSAGDIFNCPVGVGPEHYTVPEADAPPGAYLYIASWDDHAVTQGVIGQFARNAGTVTTGQAPFEVCATGLDYVTGPDGTNGPSQAIIDQQIAICNAGTGDPTTTSKGWVSATGATTAGAAGLLAVGEANDDSGGSFPIACASTATTIGIAPAAKWLWYDPQDGQAGDPFHSTGTNRFKAFLLFRLAADSIVIQ